MIDKSIIQQARQTDLAQYLISIGEPIIRNGHRHRHKNHESLVFTKNAYYWNARGEHGNSLDYLTKHIGMDFESAVNALVGHVYVPSEKEIAGQQKSIAGKKIKS